MWTEYTTFNCNSFSTFRDKESFERRVEPFPLEAPMLAFYYVGMRDVSCDGSVGIAIWLGLDVRGTLNRSSAEAK